MHPFEGTFFWQYIQSSMLIKITFELNASVNVNHFELFYVIRLRHSVQIEEIQQCHCYYVVVQIKLWQEKSIGLQVTKTQVKKQLYGSTDSSCIGLSVIYQYCIGKFYSRRVNWLSLSWSLTFMKCIVPSGSIQFTPLSLNILFWVYHSILYPWSVFSSLNNTIIQHLDYKPKTCHLEHVSQGSQIKSSQIPLYCTIRLWVPLKS